MSEKTSLESEIKRFALADGALAVGIASVAEVNKFAPEGHRPDDFLPGAKSAIVIGCHDFPKGAWRSLPQIQDTSRAQTVYRKICLDLVTFIEEKYGYYSLYLNTGLIESTLGTPLVSAKLLAELAGLGTRGLNGGIILHKEYGMMIFAPVFTTMPLEPDGLLNEVACPHPSCVVMWEREHTTPCLKVCPEALSGGIENGKIKWMEYDRYVCGTRAQTHSAQNLQRTLYEITSEKNPENQKMMILGENSRTLLNALAAPDTSVAQCVECQRVCPLCVSNYVASPSVVAQKAT